MKLVDAQPVFKRGDLAVWLVADIPGGVLRHAVSHAVDQALEPQSLAVRIRQSTADITIHRQSTMCAAVAWANLQPRKSVPRGRENMPAEKWGAHRDQDGVCTVCAADDSMWCDSVVHRASAQPERGQDIAYYAPGGDTTAPPWGAWMPGTEGGVVDAPTAARIGVPAGLQVRFRRYAGNATLAQDVWRASDGVHIARCVAVRGLRASAPAASFQQVEFEDCPLQPTVPFKLHPSPELAERVLVAMGAASGEDNNRSKISPENRALWAAALRARVQASAERERNRVVVDREVEDWE